MDIDHLLAHHTLRFEQRRLELQTLVRPAVGNFSQTIKVERSSFRITLALSVIAEFDERLREVRKRSKAGISPVDTRVSYGTLPYGDLLLHKIKICNIIAAARHRNCQVYAAFQ